MDHSPATSASIVDTVANSGILDNLAPPIQMALFLGSFVLLTAVLVSVTSFTRIIIVLSFVRRALATQEIPPTPSLIGLALFLTCFTMGPVFDRISHDAIEPYLRKEVTPVQAITSATHEIRSFMLVHTRRTDLALFPPS
jgi:flagellar biosynthetic protein FliP